MVLELDNMGAVQLANNWSVGGRTRHVDVRNYFLRECKQFELIHTKFCPGELNDTNIFTKNTVAKIFLKHLPLYVGKDDEYLQEEKSEKL